MDKIRSLLESNNYDDKMIGVYLLDSLPPNEWLQWLETNTRKGPGSCGEETSPWHHCDFVLEFHGGSGSRETRYLKGKQAHYYLAHYCVTVEFEENAKFWIEDRHFKVTDL